MSGLDPRSLIVALVTVHIVLGLVIMVSMRRNDAVSLRRMGQAMFIGGVGLTLLVLRGVVPDFLSKVVGNVLLSIEIVLMYSSVCLFFSKRHSKIWLYSPPVITAIVFASFDNQIARNIAAGTILGTQFVPVLMVIAQQGFRQQTAPRAMIFIGMSIMAIQFWLRAIGNIWTVPFLPQPHRLAVSDPTTLLVGLCAILITVTATLLLHWDANQTNLKKQRDLARVAALEKSRFLAAASHDLRQPMQAVTLYLQALGIEHLTLQQRALLNKLTVVTDDLRLLLDALLNVARLDVGGITPQLTRVDLGDLFQRLDEEVSPAIVKKGLRWKLFWQRGLPQQYTDGSLLHTLLRNLINNATKYTTKGGVMVSARMRGSRVLVQVWDTGIGIAKDDQDKIFDEFYQVNNPSRAQEHGVGLGLSIVKRLAALLQFEISYRSIVGRGTVFNVLLPETRSTEDHELSQTRENQMVAGNDWNAAHVVIVEDDERVQDALSKWFKAQGMKVSCFGSAEVALSSKKIFDADCFVTDYRLAGKMSGVAFLEEVERAAGTVQAVVITGEVVVEVEELANSRWPVLSKPVTADQLGAALRRKNHCIESRNE